MDNSKLHTVKSFLLDTCRASKQYMRFLDLYNLFLDYQSRHERPLMDNLKLAFYCKRLGRHITTRNGILMINVIVTKQYAGFIKTYKQARSDKRKAYQERLKLIDA
jgi:hypothetical protein